MCRGLQCTQGVQRMDPRGWLHWGRTLRENRRKSSESAKEPVWWFCLHISLSLGERLHLVSGLLWFESIYWVQQSHVLCPLLPPPPHPSPPPVKSGGICHRPLLGIHCTLFLPLVEHSQLPIRHESVSCTQFRNLGLLPQTPEFNAWSGVVTESLPCYTQNSVTQPVLKKPDIWPNDNEIIINQEVVN